MHRDDPSRGVGPDAFPGDCSGRVPGGGTTYRIVLDDCTYGPRTRRDLQQLRALFESVQVG